MHPAIEALSKTVEHENGVVARGVSEAYARIILQAHKLRLEKHCGI